MDLGRWLRRLGLEQYEATFRENEIDDTVLPNLTAEDLKDLGVGLVGHRRKLLYAIAALRAEASAPVPLSGEPLATDKAAEDTAERRQVTVMFSDLVGSTALSARMDPEDLREIISAYQRCVADIVRRFGGFVAKYMGDGVLVYFGYPQAHEDDAERAVRAALELIAAVNRLQFQAPLQTRIGIATGLVVIGDLVGSGEAQERGIVGETPNLAARLQAIAEPDQVVIDETTRRLIGTLFELKVFGPRDLKGFGSVPAWLALRESTVQGRFEALHGTAFSALVGREAERTSLLRQWHQAQSGHGQVALLSGEAGIGKSRLTAALVDEIASDPHVRLRYFCSPQHGDSAFYPIIGQLSRAAGFAHRDTVAAKLDKLDALLSRTDCSGESRALIADLLALPNDGRYPALAPDPQLRRQRTLQALQTQLEWLALRQPVLMIFEDAHWIDPTSLEVLSRTVERVRNLPLMLVVTFRPEFDLPWLEQPSVSMITLDRLTESEVTTIIERLVGPKKLPADIVAEIVERTDGIPLFVEEITTAVLEAESEREAKRTVATVPSSALMIPASLHASLMARLDRLGAAKRVAQIGAVIGREFSHVLLAGVLGDRAVELRPALDRLIQAGLLIRQGATPDTDTIYLFKHALVRDAAYSTLLREPRRALHARVAETLEAQFGGIAESRPELLARHCTEAGLVEKAAALWSKAGRRSLERSALVEAVEQLTRALTLIAAAPESPALRREQINAQVALITPLIHVKGYAAPETMQAVHRAHDLIQRAEARGEAPEDPLLLFSVLNGGWLTNYVAGNADAIRELSRQFFELAKKQGATAPLMLAHRMEGTTTLHFGELSQARTHLDRAIELYDPDAHRALATRFGQDVRMVSLLRRAMTLWFLGYPDAALADSQRSVSDARAIGHAATVFFALWGGYWTNRVRGSYAVAGNFLNELATLADKKGVLFWKVAGMMGRGCLAAATEKPEEAIRMIADSLTAYRSTGARLWIPETLTYLAKAHLDLGQYSEALRCTDEAQALIEATHELWYQAEIHRTAGHVLLCSPKPDPARAEAQFERALAVARQQLAKSLELRATMSLARLWRDQGKRAEARELLAPVYGWFTEGFDTSDLKQAKTLLDQLVQ
ncbi:adenylate/guanylate cyclase domain-containing protein [Bradyrhizobium sp. AUGA SZCCT0182]|uniref:ATP-binding protein n=1 Tax=Bradyrhizobium sp. AUGA SZCCT0182 TaxID=2807667 RepID=UPI001BA92072|nr:adenylate/guanylate cyclase domain-containing protein [Bradyrhizobium sp. AUGA SZCCT0182]MBR1237688.1 AAA family ATPase [Bradyrhizobium sp. AUGA SZCCT0182]